LSLNIAGRRTSARAPPPSATKASSTIIRFIGSSFPFVIPWAAGQPQKRWVFFYAAPPDGQAYFLPGLK
jgi:hypothetical protein